MKNHLLFSLAIFALGQTASGQLISFGVKGGVPIVDQTGGHDESRPYIFGPSIELRLPANFAIEADALYQRIGNGSAYSASILSGTNLSGSVMTAFSSRTRINSWEFPLLGKYYFSRKSNWQPFVGTGWAFRTLGVHSAVTETFTDSTGATQTQRFRSDFRSGPDVGAVFAAGVRLHAGRVAVLPEIRYTRWGSQSNFIRENQAGFLLGLNF